MQAGSSSSSHCDAEKKDLEELLEAFGSAFSLEDIASAYCKARNNVDTAGQILCASLGSTSHDATCTSKDKLKCARSTTSELSSELDGASAMPSEMSSDSILQNSHHGGRHTRLLKSKVRPVSMGTVSGIIAKDYAKPRPVTNEYPGSKKPPGLDSKELPISEIWREEVPPNMTAGKGTIHGYVEEFMFKMLGDGFQLDMSVIQEVLGCCGYDVQKGHFFNRMAREVDEKSAQKLLEASPQDVVSLDLHDQEPKNALRLLRLHLTTFSGIAVLKHLRIIVGNSDEDTKGARRRLILKLLSKESIKWTKDADGRTIMILVDGINPERLSFWKK